MDSDHSRRGVIVNKIILKSNLKHRIFDNTFAVFNELKDTLHEMAADIDEATDNALDRRIRIEYRDRGKFEAQIQIAGDILIFSMHTNVFEFNNSQKLRQTEYIKSNPENSYCGVINVYNFLSDSFKFNRNADEGYLVGRIFINQHKMYFVEGNVSTGIRYDDFGSQQVNKEELVKVIEGAIDFALDFDLYVPPYNTAKIVEVEQFNTKFEISKMETGKRLGYDYDVEM